MPASEHDRRSKPAGSTTRQSAGHRAVSAVPSFLREDRPRATSRPATTLPRPATPQHPEDRPAPRLDPASLPMPSLSRRRVVTAAGVLLAGWLAISFVKQVGEATAASNHAADLRAQNIALQDEVARLQEDLTHVQDPRYIQLTGRAYGLGGRGEVPFALAAGAPELAPDAPGSAAVRLGAEPIDRSPLDVWLEVLFGDA
jgi:hypothetical protein